MRYALSLALVATVLACGGGGGGDDAPAGGAEPSAPAAEEQSATVLGDGVETLPETELERGRNDPGWRQYTGSRRTQAGPQGQPQRGDTGQPQRGAAPADTAGEAWSDISAQTLERGAPALPLGEGAEGPSVAIVQILLDRALFSPGIIDGRWGKNTAKAIYWLQDREGLDATGEVDAATVQRLRSLAGDPGSAVRRHRVTEADVSGPFVDRIPDDVYAKADLSCMCYTSQAEQLAERFHSSRDLLSQLNPGVSLEAVQVGDELVVPAVRDAGAAAAGADVARIVVSDGGHWVHAVDAEGRVVYHFPSTLGSEYAPSPGGEYSVTAIAWDPTWHYQPELLTGEPDDREDAIVPAGPNNPVGVVWMQLSKPHYGIHGTSAPETIGYATSHGCVRLTNWDARFLGEQVSEGVAVEFTDEAR